MKINISFERHVTLSYTRVWNIICLKWRGWATPGGSYNKAWMWFDATMSIGGRSAVAFSLSLYLGGCRFTLQHCWFAPYHALHYQSYCPRGGKMTVTVETAASTVVARTCRHWWGRYSTECRMGVRVVGVWFDIAYGFVSLNTATTWTKW